MNANYYTENYLSHAGKDFIIQTDYDVYGLPPLFGVVTKSDKIIYKNRNNAVK